MRTTTMLLLALLLAGCSTRSAGLEWPWEDRGRETMFSADEDWNGLALIQQLRGRSDDDGAGIRVPDPCDPCKVRCYSREELQCMLDLLRWAETARGCEDDEPQQLLQVKQLLMGTDGATINADELRGLLERALDDVQPAAGETPAPAPPIAQLENECPPTVRVSFPAPPPSQCRVLRCCSRC